MDVSLATQMCVCVFVCFMAQMAVSLATEFGKLFLNDTGIDDFLDVQVLHHHSSHHQSPFPTPHSCPSIISNRRALLSRGSCRTALCMEAQVVFRWHLDSAIDDLRRWSLWFVRMLARPDSL